MVFHSLFLYRFLSSLHSFSSFVSSFNVHIVESKLHDIGTRRTGISRCSMWRHLEKVFIMFDIVYMWQNSNEWRKREKERENERQTWIESTAPSCEPVVTNISYRDWINVCYCFYRFDFYSLFRLLFVTLLLCKHNKLVCRNKTLTNFFFLIKHSRTHSMYNERNHFWIPNQFVLVNVVNKLHCNLFQFVSYSEIILHVSAGSVCITVSLFSFGLCLRYASIKTPSPVHI